MIYYLKNLHSKLNNIIVELSYKGNFLINKSTGRDKDLELDIGFFKLHDALKNKQN